MDWDDLPEDAQKAFTILGSSKEAWDNDDKVPSFDKDWDDLTPEEQKAARSIGWDREAWCEELEDRRKRIRKA